MTLRATYDPSSDVMYLRVGAGGANHATEDERGIVWRYGHEGNLVGATVLDFEDKWSGDRSAFTRELASVLNTLPGEMSIVIESALRAT